MLPWCTPEEARIRLSQNHWSLQPTIRKALPSECKGRAKTESQPRSLVADLECEIIAPEVSIQTSLTITPKRVALIARDAPQPPAFLTISTNLFRMQEVADVKQVVTCEGALSEGSLSSFKACDLTLINIKRDNLRRRILQYESSLAEITKLQDKLALSVHEVDSLPRSLLAEF